MRKSHRDEAIQSPSNKQYCRNDISEIWAEFNKSNGQRYTVNSVLQKSIYKSGDEEKKGIYPPTIYATFEITLLALVNVFKGFLDSDIQ